MTGFSREYIGVTPSRSELSASTVVKQVEGFHQVEKPGGFLGDLNPLKTPPTWEFLALTRGEDEPVEFYYGVEHEALHNTLERRLSTLYPSAFKLERSSLNPEEVLNPSRVSHGETKPLGVKWVGRMDRPRDWMTCIPRFSEYIESGDRSSRSPMAPLIELLSDACHPVAFQVVFRRKPEWRALADGRIQDLQEGTDTFFDKVIEATLGSPSTRDDRHRPSNTGREHYVDTGGRKRAKHINRKNPAHTFNVNLRALTQVSKNQDREEIDYLLNDLGTVFDTLQGPFYRVKKKRLDGLLGRSKKEYSRFLKREVKTGGLRRRTRAELVLNARELANFVVVPSSGHLTTEGSRGTRASPRTRSPLPRPQRMEQYREGMAIGFALDDNGEPEDIPTCVPADLLREHYLRIGVTGTGKSKSLCNDALSCYSDTEGPVFLIDKKGDGLSENYMRAHAEKFGFEDLEENVIHFKIPDILPGFAFFDIEKELENGRRRIDAIQDKADHYEEVVKMGMGAEKYERAITAPPLIHYLIKALYDEEYGLDNGHYRESVNKFAHIQLEYVLSQLQEANKEDDLEEVPMSCDRTVQRKLMRQLERSPADFSRTVGAVSNRLDSISSDHHLNRIFNNTESRFDFHDFLDENKVVIFDLGDMREYPGKTLTGMILTELKDALETRGGIPGYSDEYAVNLLIDEAASVVQSDVMSWLLEEGRGFGLSVGLALQFSEQMREEGNKQVYLNIINDVSTKLVSQVPIDEDIAKALSNEAVDPVEFLNRINSIPKGEWIAQLPTEFGKTPPEPFNLKPLPIPPGHPESDEPFNEHMEQRFQESLERLHETVQHEYGVPDREMQEPPTDYTPSEVSSVLGISGDIGLDEMMAVSIHVIQTRYGVEEENGYVSVREVDNELKKCYEVKDLEEEQPDHGVLADIRERSPLLDVDLDESADEVVIRLTERGEETVEKAMETGDVRSAGNDKHDDLLGYIRSELTRLGFTVGVVEQDSSEQTDANAFYSDEDMDLEFNVEVETTTPNRPAKILKNLQKAQESERIPLFVVESEKIAKRVENILNPPTKREVNGEIYYYTTDDRYRFYSREKGSVVAVRHSSESVWSVWYYDRVNEEFVLRDKYNGGEEHLRIPDLEDVSQDSFPAVYYYDSETDEYTVYQDGETTTYTDEDEFKDDWTEVRRPFVPDIELPISRVRSDTFRIVVASEHGGAYVYDDGETYSLEVLIEDPPRLAMEGYQEHDGNIDIRESSVGAFATRFLVEKEDATISFDKIYDTYLEWAEEKDIPEDDVASKNWFGRRIRKYMSFETDRVWINDEHVRMYEGVTFADKEPLPETK